MPREHREFNEREREILDLILAEIERLLKELRTIQTEDADAFNEFREAGIGNPVVDLRMALETLLDLLREFVEYRDSEHALQVLMQLSNVSGQSETVTARLEEL